MRKHKWRRRIILLIILFIVAAAVLPSDRKTGRQPADTEQSQEAGRKESEETVVGWMIDRIASGEVDLSDESSIRRTLDEAQQDLGISLAEEDKEKVVGFLQTLGDIGIETGDFIEQAKQKYQQYSVGFVEEANEAINNAVSEAVESTVSRAAKSFVDSIRQALGDFFTNLIP